MQERKNDELVLSALATQEVKKDADVLPQNQQLYDSSHSLSQFPSSVKGVIPPDSQAAQLRRSWQHKRYIQELPPPLPSPIQLFPSGVDYKTAKDYLGGLPEKDQRFSAEDITQMLADVQRQWSTVQPLIHDVMDSKVMSSPTAPLTEDHYAVLYAYVNQMTDKKGPQLQTVLDQLLSLIVGDITEDSTTTINQTFFPMCKHLYDSVSRLEVFRGFVYRWSTMGVHYYKQGDMVCWTSFISASKDAGAVCEEEMEAGGTLFIIQSHSGRQLSVLYNVTEDGNVIGHSTGDGRVSSEFADECVFLPNTCFIVTASFLHGHLNLVHPNINVVALRELGCLPGYTDRELARDHLQVKLESSTSLQFLYKPLEQFFIPPIGRPMVQVTQLAQFDLVTHLLQWIFPPTTKMDILLGDAKNKMHSGMVTSVNTGVTANSRPTDEDDKDDCQVGPSLKPPSPSGSPSSGGDSPNMANTAKNLADTWVPGSGGSLLLAGMAGAGKTTVCLWLLAKVLQYNQQKMRQLTEQGQRTSKYLQHYLVPLFICIERVDNPYDQGSILKYIQTQYAFSKEEMDILKNSCNVLLFIDGYIEVDSNIHGNVYDLNGFSSWNSLYCIFTCREDALVGRDARAVFGKPLPTGNNVHLLQRCHITPFTDSQVKQYLTQLHYSDNDMLELYSLPGISKLLTSPFILHMIGSIKNRDLINWKESRCKRYGSLPINRCEIYELYIQNISEMNISKTASTTIQLEHVIQYYTNLATLMTAENRQMGKVKDYKNKVPIPGRKEDEDAILAITMDDRNQRDSLFRCAPLWTESNHDDSWFGYTHNTLQEYGVARCIFTSLTWVVHTIGALLRDRIGVLQYFRELYQRKSVPERQYVYNQLLEMVLKTRTHEDRKTKEYASTAITLLNVTGNTLSSLNLDNIKIEKANLQGALMWGCSLNKADLRNVKLEGIMLDGCSVCESNLMNCHTGTEKTLRGNTERVLSVAFSPDGEVVVSTGADHTCRVFNLEDGEQMKEIMEEPEMIPCSCLTPDSKIITGCRNGSIKIWDYINDHKHELEGHKDGVFTLCVTNDGTTIISGGDDKLIKYWDITTHLCTKILKGHHKAVLCVAASPNMKYVASCGEENTLRLWDYSTGELLNVMADKGSTICSLAFTPNSQYIVSALGPHIAVWDVTDGCPVSILSGHEGIVKAIAISPDGDLIGSAGQDKTVRIWNMDGVEINRGKHSKAVHCVAFSRDGQSVVSGSADRTIRVWSIKEGAIWKRHEQGGHNRPVKRVAWLNPLGPSFGKSGRTSPVLELQTPASQTAPPGSDGGRSNIRIAGGSGEAVVDAQPANFVACNILSSGLDYCTKVWSIDTGELLYQLPGQNGVVYSEDKDNVLIGTTLVDNTINIWKINTSQQAPPTPKHELSQFLSNTTTTTEKPTPSVISGSVSDIGVHYQNQMYTQYSTIGGHADHTTSLDISPDGLLVGSSSTDRSVRLWSIDQAVECTCYSKHTDCVNYVLFSPIVQRNGTQLIYTLLSASAENTNNLHIWQFVRQEQQEGGHSDTCCVCVGHTSSVDCMIFSKNGNLLITASKDKTVKFWNISKYNTTKVDQPQTDSCLIGNIPHADEVHCIDAICSPHYKSNEKQERLVTCCKDAKIRLYDITKVSLEEGAYPDPNNNSAIIPLHNLTFDTYSRSIISVSFSPCGTQIITGGEDSSVRVWNLPSDDGTTKPQLLLFLVAAQAMTCRGSSFEGAQLDVAPKRLITERGGTT